MANLKNVETSIPKGNGCEALSGQISLYLYNFLRAKVGSLAQALRACCGKKGKMTREAQIFSYGLCTRVTVGPSVTHTFS